MVTKLTYATTTQFANALGVKKDVPSWDVSETPSNEIVGQGDNSKQVFYLAHQKILSSTYVLYYGSDASTTDPLIETTDYNLDKDHGKITLTSEGVIKLGTSNIYATYSYTENIQDSYLETVLIRAQKEVDGEINSHFTDKDSTNPEYPFVEEITASEGYFENRVIVKQKPLIDISSTLDGDITDSQTTINLATGTGVKYPSSGYLVIGSEVITYSGISTDELTGVVRGVFGEAQSHLDSDEVHSTCFLKSDTSEGSAVVWTVQPWDINMYANSNGLIYSFKDVYPYATTSSLARTGVANRIKILYFSGYDTIPEDINRLTLIFAKRQFIQDSIGKALISGRDEFQPEMFNVDTSEINRIIGTYIVIPMGNT